MIVNYVFVKNIILKTSIYAKFCWWM